MATKRKSKASDGGTTGKRPTPTTPATQTSEPRRSDEQRRESATRRAPDDPPTGLGKMVRGGYAEQQPVGAATTTVTPSAKKRRP